MTENVVNGIKVPFLPARGVEGLKEHSPVGLPADRPFEKILQEELQDLKFSKHAQERLDSRDIHLNDEDMSQLRHAVSLAQEKGGHDSLVLLRNIAFIVNINNRTVVTAVDSEHLKENVFTNIDSAVIAGS